MNLNDIIKKSNKDNKGLYLFLLFLSFVCYGVMVNYAGYQDEIIHKDSPDFVELSNHYIIKKYDEKTDSLLLFNPISKKYRSIKLVELKGYRKVSEIKQSNESLNMVKE